MGLNTKKKPHMHEHALLGLVKTAACALTPQRNSENFESNNTVMKAEGKLGMTQKKEMHGIAVVTFGWKFKMVGHNPTAQSNDLRSQVGKQAIY